MGGNWRSQAVQIGRLSRPACSAPRGLGGHAVTMPTLSWLVGDLGGSLTANVTSVTPGACDHIVLPCSLYVEAVAIVIFTVSSIPYPPLMPPQQ